MRTDSSPWLIEPFAVIDGGLSTALELLGHAPAGLLWTAHLLIDQPEVIVAAHRSYVDAGADIIISASYQATEAGFVAAGCSPAEARRALACTTDLARRAGAPVVAASIGPFGATLGDGSEYHGRYAASWADVRRVHHRRLAVLADTGPDLFAIETMPSQVEAEIVLEELASMTDIPAWVSFTCADAVHTCAGDMFADVIEVVTTSSQVIAAGANCTDPQHVAGLLRAAGGRTRSPLLAYPNHGRAWDAEQRCWLGASEDDLAAHAEAWVALGARLIGGCCGVGPDGVRGLVHARAALASGT